MTWWAGLLIGALSAGLVAALIALWTKPKAQGLTSDEQNALTKVKLDQKDLELQIAKETNEKLLKVSSEYALKISVLKSEFDKLLKEIEDEKTADYKRYLEDANAAGTELDKLIGIGSTDKPT